MSGKKKLDNNKKQILLTKMPYKIGYPDNHWIQERVHYAYTLSLDQNFVYLLEAENGKWDEKRKGVTGEIGICQISPYYHPEITKDINFYFWKWQINKCWELYKGGVKFYGKANIYKTKNHFIWK